MSNLNRHGLDGLNPDFLNSLSELEKITDRTSLLSKALQTSLVENGWKPQTKRAIKKWFQTHVSSDLFDWHIAWEDIAAALHKTPSGKFMWNYDEFAE